MTSSDPCIDMLREWLVQQAPALMFEYDALDSALHASAATQQWALEKMLNDIEKKRHDERKELVSRKVLATVSALLTSLGGRVPFQKSTQTIRIKRCSVLLNCDRRSIWTSYVK